MKSILVEVGSEVVALIPRELCAELKLEAGDIDVSVEDGRIIVTVLPKKDPRDGWEESARQIAAEGGGGPVWIDTGGEPSDEWTWPGLGDEAENEGKQ